MTAAQSKGKSASPFTYGDPIAPQPVEEAFIKAIENSGARPSFIEAIRAANKRINEAVSEYASGHVHGESA